MKHAAAAIVRNIVLAVVIAVGGAGAILLASKIQSNQADSGS